MNTQTLVLKQDGKVINAPEYDFRIANDACAGIECRKNGLSLYFIWVGGDLSIAPIDGNGTACLNKSELGKALMLATGFEAYYQIISNGKQPF